MHNIKDKPNHRYRIAIQKMTLNTRTLNCFSFFLDVTIGFKLCGSKAFSSSNQFDFFFSSFCPCKLQLFSKYDLKLKVKKGRFGIEIMRKKREIFRLGCTIAFSLLCASKTKIHENTSKTSLKPILTHTCANKNNSVFFSFVEIVSASIQSLQNMDQIHFEANHSSFV